MATGNSIDDILLEVLHEADLEHFADQLAEKLQVTRLDHFSHVKDSDLSGIGLSQPAIKRLKAHIKDKKSTLKRHQKTSFAILKSGRLSPNLPIRNKSNGDTPEESSHVTCLISKDDLKLLETLGEGSFGVVKRAAWRKSNGRKVDVAVKILRSFPGSGDFSEDSLQEISAMHALRHPNLIRLYGLVLSPPIMMVTELCEGGALLDRLRSSNLPVLLMEQLLDYGIQISKGMAYLESKMFIHRDLAARNVLLSSDERVVKIGDFGLMRALPNKEQHYVMSGQKKVPFAWCPPESLKFRQFSYASDVWAFGVTLWEMFSFGEEPWCTMTGAEILQKVTAGERLPEPDACPSSLYQLMMQCWSFDPAQRPTFAALKELLGEQSVLLYAKCKEAQTGEGLLEIDVGDRLIIIDGSADNYYWYGQNIRTRKLGKFARKSVALEESSTAPSGSSIFFNSGSGLTSHDISRPIRGSFVHTGHGDVRGGESWGKPDEIDPIYLKNPLWIPTASKKTTNVDKERRKANSISCGDDQQALLHHDEQLSNQPQPSKDDRRPPAGQRPLGEFVPRRTDVYQSNSVCSEPRNISSGTNTSGGESSSFGSSSGCGGDYETPSIMRNSIASVPPSRPYYSVPVPEEKTFAVPAPMPPVITVTPRSPNIQRLYDDVAADDDPFEVPTEVKTLTTRQRYSEMYSPLPVPQLPPPPTAQYSRIVKKESHHQQQQVFQFASTMPASVTEVRPAASQERIAEARSAPPVVLQSVTQPASPAKTVGHFNSTSGLGIARPTAITRPFIQQTNSGPPATNDPAPTAPIYSATMVPHQQKSNLFMDELSRRLQATNFNQTDPMTQHYYNGGAYGMQPPQSGFLWTGTLSNGTRTQSVPDVSATIAFNNSSATVRKLTNADTHQLLDLFDPLTSKGPPDDLVSKVREHAPFASPDRCTVMLQRCNMNVQAAVRELKTEKLLDMGLAANRLECVRALETSGWDVNAAAGKLLG